jgi:hypothetical protein
VLYQLDVFGQTKIPCLNKNITGLQTISDEIENVLDIYLKLFIMLYADDTALLAETANNLQAQLDSFYEYCNLWKLKKGYMFCPFILVLHHFHNESILTYNYYMTCTILYFEK